MPPPLPPTTTADWVAASYGALSVLGMLGGWVLLTLFRQRHPLMRARAPKLLGMQAFSGSCWILGAILSYEQLEALRELHGGACAAVYWLQYVFGLNLFLVLLILRLFTLWRVWLAARWRSRTPLMLLHFAPAMTVGIVVVITDDGHGNIGGCWFSSGVKVATLVVCGLNTLSLCAALLMLRGRPLPQPFEERRPILRSVALSLPGAALLAVAIMTNAWHSVEGRVFITIIITTVANLGFWILVAPLCGTLVRPTAHTVEFSALTDITFGPFEWDEMLVTPSMRDHFWLFLIRHACAVSLTAADMELTTATSIVPPRHMAALHAALVSFRHTPTPAAAATILKRWLTKGSGHIVPAPDALCETLLALHTHNDALVNRDMFEALENWVLLILRRYYAPSYFTASWANHYYTKIARQDIGMRRAQGENLLQADI